MVLLKSTVLVEKDTMLLKIARSQLTMPQLKVLLTSESNTIVASCAMSISLATSAPTSTNESPEVKVPSVYTKP